MIEHESQYLEFIRARGVGANDRVASSPDSYVSYLKSVSKLLAQDITPALLRSETDVKAILRKIARRRAPKTISNYRSAMRQYVAFVLHSRLVPDVPEYLQRISVVRKSGTERFRNGSEFLDFDLLSFWQWSSSDILSNATRGVVAEYLVARALGIDREGVRDEWAAYDLETSEGLRIEVKSAAYLQSWLQTAFSRISFTVRKTLAWDPDTNRQSTVPTRQAHVYVFALLAHRDKQSVDPMDVSQWRFYVLPTTVLDSRTRSQHSITLPTLERRSEGAVCYSGLAEAVDRVAQGAGFPPNNGLQRSASPRAEA